jgi:hypothetical protein
MKLFQNSGFKGIIGVSRRDITPPVGIYSRNWGAAKTDVAEGVHRPLTLTSLSFQSDKEEKPLVIIAADLGWWKSKEDEWFLRGPILDALSLHPARLMFCLSHTHAGPSLFREDICKPGGQFIEPYLKFVQEAAIQAAQDALSNATLATLTWGCGKCDLATNRDLPEPNSDRFICGFNPLEKADDTLLVGRVTTDQGNILATVVNYACHPTTLAWDNQLLSPDYVGAMREVIEKQSQAPCLFLQGASGDLAPAEQYVGDISVAESHGRKLGHAVLSTLEGMLPAQMALAFKGVVESSTALALWQRSPVAPSSVLVAEMIEVGLPLKPLATLAEIEQEWRDCADPVLKERLWRKRAVRKAVGDGAISKAPVWVWRLGDSILIGQPNEVYSEFQEILRGELAHNAVAVMNVVNGHVGYLPPKRWFGKNVYAVTQTPFASGALELLTKVTAEAALGLMRNK